MESQNLTKAGLEWQKTVEAEHAQSDRIREEAASDDFWRPVAHRFVPPKRGELAQDDTVEKLAEFVSPDGTVLDIGAGGGRLAIPLTDYCSHVTAVEPSEAMRERLVATAEAWDVTNISVIPDSWEDTEVEPHDLVVSAHVVYTVQPVELFVRKMTNHAKRTAALISFERPATATYLPLWTAVHGEARIELPSFQQITTLLAEMEIDFDLTPLTSWDPRPFKDREQAQTECEARLFVRVGSEKSRVLSDVLDDSLVEVEGGVRLRWAESHRPMIISWSTQTL